MRAERPAHGRTFQRPRGTAARGRAHPRVRSASERPEPRAGARPCGSPPRLTAPPTRTASPGCKKVYKLDPTPALVKLTVADAGIQALDDGLAEVAVAFSSNPQLSRPDVVTLRDDRHMVGADHVDPGRPHRDAAPLRARRCGAG